MCGIVAVIGDLWGKEETLMKRLLLFDWIRGPDATGIAVVRNSNEVKVAKVNDHPLVLFDTGRFREALNGNISKVFLGHNRLATSGDKSNANTHPFEVDHIVGVHNGTIWLEDFKKLNEELGEEYTVDSHAIIAAIAKFGLKKAVGKIRGAYSIVYYDKSNDTINCIRNKDRPMTYGYTKDFKKLFLASDCVITDAALKMTGGYELFADKDGDSYFQTAVDTHYQWSVADLKAGSDKIPKPKVKNIKGKETVLTGNNNSHFPRPHSDPITRNSGSRGNTTGTGTESTNTGTSSARLTTHQGSRYNGGREGVHKCIGSRLRPFGSFLSRSDFELVAQYGCTWCEEPIEFGETGVVVFERGPTVICGRCSGEGRRNRLVVKNKSEVPCH